MGEYFYGVVLSSKDRKVSNKKKVLAYVLPRSRKLLDHAYRENDSVRTFEMLINREKGKYAGNPVVWAGDYAKPEPRTWKKKEVNIYDLICNHNLGYMIIYPEDILHHFRYVINEETKEYVDSEKCPTDKYGYTRNPLPMLICDGNGEERYYGANMSWVGKWARQVVTTSDFAPGKDFKELDVYFTTGF